MQLRSSVRNDPSRVDPVVDASTVISVSSSIPPPLAGGAVSWEKDTVVLSPVPPPDADDFLFAADAHKEIQSWSSSRRSG